MAEPRATYQVLVIDDNLGDLSLLQEAVTSTGVPISLTTCRDGQEALGILADRRGFDLILSDLNMPGMTGAQLFRQLKQDPRLQRIPMVMMSSSDRERLPQRINEAIDVPYFTKASTWSDFLRLAREILAVVSDQSSTPALSGHQLAERMTPAQGFAKFKADGPLLPPYA